jgi:ureidoacrylate peracid hydrolase
MSDTVAHCETGGPRMKSKAGSTSHPFRNSATNGISSQLEPGAEPFREEFTPLPGEVVAQEHWCSSGFANTDLDLQLKRHGIHKLIVIGQKANTCIDSTVRYAAELGYDVTLVKDAIASFRWEEMQATLELNLPNYATSILSAADTIAALEQTS